MQTIANYFIAGTVAMVLSWILQGCRFGNRVEEAPPPAPADTISGYYQTSPQEVRFCASTDKASGCSNAPGNQVPALISQVMNNPVALLVDDLASGSALLFDPRGNGEALPVVVDPKDGRLTFLGYTQPVTLWDDPACQNQLFVEESGEIRKGPVEQVSGFPTQGRLELQISVVSPFDGACTLSLQRIYSCFLDFKKCGGGSDGENLSLQSVVHEMFQPYIQNGVIKSEDIPNLISLSYDVSYE